MNIVAQVIGLLAIISYAISPHAKTKKRVLVFHLISSILYALQYFLLNAFSAMITNTVGAVKCYVFYLYEKKGKEIPKSLFWIFMLIILALGILTYNNIYSLIPILTSILSLYAVWQNNLKVFRAIVIISSISWIAYNIIVGAYIGVIGNVFQLSSAIIAIIRFDILKEKQNSK